MRLHFDSIFENRLMVFAVRGKACHICLFLPMLAISKFDSFETPPSAFETPERNYIHLDSLQQSRKGIKISWIEN
jgi:hypothetical protein